MPKTANSQEAPTKFIPVGKWQPDVPVPLNDGMPFALNLVPKSTGFYGPEKALATAGDTEVTTPFGAAVKAHGSFHSVPPVSGNSPRYFLGTYAIGAGASRIISRPEQGAWENLSIAGGYSITASTPWRFTNFGNKVLACNLSTNTQISDGGSGIFREVSSRQRAEDIATVRGFAMTVNTIDLDFGEGAQPYRVGWSAIGDAETWPDPLSDQAINVQSGFRDLFGGGQLRRLIPGIGGADAVIISDRKMWRVRFVGPPATWEFDEIETDQGTSMGGSVAAFNETFFFYGHNGFYHFDGANSNPIGQGVMDEFFLSDASFSSALGLQRSVEAAIDSENKCYVISYRSDAAITDFNDRIFRFNWITQTWSNSAISIDVLGHMDSFSSAVDSPRIVMVDQSFQTVRPTGQELEAILEMRENTHETGAVMNVLGLRPYIDSADVVATVRLRNFPYEDLIDSAERGWQSDAFIRFYDDPQAGRFYRSRFRVPAGSDWTNITGVLYEFQEWSQGPTRLT